MGATFDGALSWAPPAFLNNLYREGQPPQADASACGAVQKNGARAQWRFALPSAVISAL